MSWLEDAAVVLVGVITFACLVGWLVDILRWCFGKGAR